MAHNERTSEGLKPSGQRPNARALPDPDRDGSPQTMEIVIRKLCAEFSLPDAQNRTLASVITSLHARMTDLALEEAVRLPEVVPMPPSASVLPNEEEVRSAFAGRRWKTLSAKELEQATAELQLEAERLKEALTVDAHDVALRENLGLSGTQADFHISNPGLRRPPLGPVPNLPPQPPTEAHKKLYHTFYECIAYCGDDILNAPAAAELLKVCVEMATFLMQKNAAYGDSALNPLRFMSRADSAEQIRVRIDDKLSRMTRGKAAGEDPLLDLVGYWVLLQVAEARQKKG